MKEEVFLPYARPSLDATDIEAITQSLNTPIITRGPQVKAFEEAFASFCDVKYAVAFNNGTAALMAAYFAADLGPKDRLITTPNSFVATTGAAVLRGATPIFLDIDKTSGNLDLNQLEYNLERSPSRGRICIAPTHFAGIPLDMSKIDRLVQDPHIIIIEDAAHALGSTYASGKKVGSCAWSHMTMFSFHPAKTITTGEGGMVTTNDEKLYHRLQLFRDNGIERNPSFLEEESLPWYYEVHDLTGNYNFTEFQAALGLSQMKRLDHFIEKRKSLMKSYRQLLKSIPHIQLFSESYDEQSVYHLCVVQIDFDAYKTTRAEVMNQLREKNIGTQVHYIPIYRHPYFKRLCGDIKEYYPQMESYYSQALSLPFYYGLTDKDIERVVHALQSTLGAH